MMRVLKTSGSLDEEIRHTTKTLQGQLLPLRSRQEDTHMEKKDKYNSSGCLDMTAFFAMRNIEREERARSKQDSGKRKKRRKSKGRSKQNRR